MVACVLEQQLLVLTAELPDLGFCMLVEIAISGLSVISPVLPAVLRYLRGVSLLMGGRSPCCYKLGSDCGMISSDTQ